MFAHISNETAKMDGDCWMFAYVSNETAKIRKNEEKK